MMHRGCSGHVMGPCTCGIFHTQTNSSSFSAMIFSKPYDNESCDMYCSSSSSSVDCTLSLGTPSTRFTEDEEKRSRHQQSPSVPNFCWDLLQSKHTPHSMPSRGTNCNTSTTTSTDPLLARRCANCDTTSTPLWRNGPRGPKSLCNACGIRFKKEERRASAAATAPTESAQMYSHHSNAWYAHPQSQKMQCLPPAMANEFRYVDDADRDSDNAIPFLSWRLNVTDRTSLVHDFTR